MLPCFTDTNERSDRSELRPMFHTALVKWRSTPGFLEVPPNLITFPYLLCCSDVLPNLDYRNGKKLYLLKDGHLKSFGLGLGWNVKQWFSKPTHPLIMLVTMAELLTLRNCFLLHDKIEIAIKYSHRSSGGLRAPSIIWNKNMVLGTNLKVNYV